MRTSKADRSLADREERLEVVLGVDLERDHRRGPRDPFQLTDLARDDLRELVLSLETQHGDEIPLACDRVGLGDAFDVGQLAAERRERGPLGLDENDRVSHVVYVWPGSRTTTFEPVADS